MTAAAVFELPNQPSSSAPDAMTGAVTYVPLGGDGKTAPIGAYSLRSLNLPGDGVGAASIAVAMDPRYASLIVFMHGAIEDATPGTDEWIKLTVESDTTAAMVTQEDVPAAPTNLGARDFSKMFTPPPIILPGGGDGSIIRAQFEDASDRSFVLEAYILLWDIRVRELTPMSLLVAASGPMWAST